MYWADISFFIRRWYKTQVDRLIEQVTKRRINFVSKFTKNTITQVVRTRSFTNRERFEYSLDFGSGKFNII